MISENNHQLKPSSRNYHGSDRRWVRILGVVFSILGAGLFYLIWLAAFLLAANLESPIVEAIFWLLAPVITGAGFATGIAIFERLTRTRGTRFLNIYVWSLVGCGVGAGIVYWFGPMLIVFGMFAAGTVSIILREVIQFSRGQYG